MVMKILWLFFLVFVAIGCADQDTQESSDSDVVIDVDHSDVENDDGTTSDCEPTYSGENCCYNPDSNLVNFKVIYDTFVCHLYCSRTVDGGPTDKCNLD